MVGRETEREVARSDCQTIAVYVPFAYCTYSVSFRIKYLEMALFQRINDEDWAKIK